MNRMNGLGAAGTNPVNPANPVREGPFRLFASSVLAVLTAASKHVHSASHTTTHHGASGVESQHPRPAHVALGPVMSACMCFLMKGGAW